MFRSRPRTAVVQTVDRPTVVLGSSQPPTVVEPGIGGPRVVRRRSGGGAVWMAPGDPVWLDVWLPRGDPLWTDDVIAAPGWFGAAWASALRSLGSPPLAVHEGPSVTAAWSDLVCFAGVGPGEVVSGGRKVVGISQWRSREGALFSSACYRRWQPAPLVAALAPPLRGAPPSAAELAEVAIGLDDLVAVAVTSHDLLDAVRSHLPEPPGWDVLHSSPPTD